MNAMVEPQAFVLPKQPKVRQKDAPPDQRKIAVIPIRACTDPELTLGMMRTLVLICSYMNRAGITWVSQARLATDLKVSQQAVSKHLVKLTKSGYLEVIRKPIRGQRMTTWRVIFDKSVDLETAVAVTSSMEDTRPPHMKEQQQEDLTPDPEGQRRVAQLIAKVLKQPPTRSRTMPKSGQTRAVKQMHEEIEKAGKKRQSKTAHAQPPEVVQPQAKNAQPPRVDVQPPEVVNPTTSTGCVEHIFNKVIYNLNVLNNQQIERLKLSGLNDSDIAENLEHLLAAYEAEGLTPNPDRLVDEILQLARIGQ